MNIIILAAGKGTRLAPLTDDRPKGMVPLAGKPILQHQQDLFQKFDFAHKVIVTGYREDNINLPGTVKVFNEKFDTTNMVASFMCAEEYFNDDIIISYGDIVYSESVLRSLVDSDAPISVVVDNKWQQLWDLRMEDPLKDAETMKIRNGKIAELGKKPQSMDEIEGQYIGLIKFKADFLKEAIAFYKGLDKSAVYDGKDYNNMYMTSFIQLIIDKFNNVQPVFINGGWLEVDSVEDLETYEKVKYYEKEGIFS